MMLSKNKADFFLNSQKYPEDVANGVSSTPTQCGLNTQYHSGKGNYILKLIEPFPDV